MERDTDKFPSGNISKIKGLLSNLETLELEYNAFFNLALDMFCIASREGYFIKVNPRWTEVLGWSYDELTNSPFTDFVHPEDREKTQETFSNLKSGELVVDLYNRYRTKSGQYVCLVWRATIDDRRNAIYASARPVTKDNAHEVESRFSNGS